MSNTAIMPVILCGGSGTRLWPASRENHPKQFLSLMGERSLLQETVNRALAVTGAKADMLGVVTLEAQAEKVTQQLTDVHEDAAGHVLAEPCARNTAAAVAFAAEYARRQYGEDTVLWILPADHHMGDESALADAYRAGLNAAAQGYLVTFGINPTKPETGYGYILQGEPVTHGAAHSVSKFVEKPDLATATAYLESGEYLWNSGMFLFNVKTVLAEFEQHAPSILSAVSAAMDGAAQDGRADAALYEAIPSEPFDKAIMEKSARAAVVPCNPLWSDIGSWDSLWEIRASEADDQGNVSVGNVFSYDVKNSLIEGGDKLIACAGLENIVVVDTGDAILIADRRNGDAIKGLVSALKNKNLPETVDH
jgi:mannose-1-phosphate guanylyltransferase/mannose-6-phosphate isomerase